MFDHLTHKEKEELSSFFRESSRLSKERQKEWKRLIQQMQEDYNQILVNENASDRNN